MRNVHGALSAITDSVKNIDQMSHQIAATAEEQSYTAQEIEQNTTAIAKISEEASHQIREADKLNYEMAELSQKQKDLISRFQ